MADDTTKIPDPSTGVDPETEHEDAPPAETDPVSVAEADALDKEPETPVSPDEVKGLTEGESGSSAPPLTEDLQGEAGDHSDGSGDDGSGAAKDPPVDEPAPVSDLEPGEDPHSAGVDTGSTAPLDSAGTSGAAGATAPGAEPSAPESATSASEGTSGTEGASAAPAPASEPETDVYEGLHSVAKPLADALGPEITESIRKAANALFAAKEKIDAADLEEVQGDAYWILSNLRNQAVGVLAAVESIFKRTR